MKVRHLLFGAAFCAVTAMWNSAVYSQAKDEKKPEAAKPAAATQPPAAKPADKPGTATPPAAGKPAGDKGSPGGSEAESIIKMMQEMSAPVKEHEALKPLVGSFTCSTKFYSAPGDPPQESTGTVERKWILGATSRIDNDVSS